jgi:Ca2+/H+ antiporter, TMEM165/GDT1 family
MIEAFAMTYMAVLAAEVVGDKFLYTTGILATRYRPTPMMAGITVAFMIKMGAAVIVGDTIASLPRSVLGAVTAIGVVWVALRFWGSGDLLRRDRPPSGTSEALMVSCASVLFSEWADFGQLTAAAMAVRFDAPVLVWSGAVAAMLTKGLVAAALGDRIRKRFHDRLARPAVVYVSVALLLLIGGLSVAETLFAHR